MVTLVCAHVGNGSRYGCHQQGVDYPEYHLATMAAFAACVVLAAHGVFCWCVLRFHAVGMLLFPHFYKNGCIFTDKM